MEKYISIIIIIACGLIGIFSGLFMKKTEKSNVYEEIYTKI